MYILLYANNAKTTLAAPVTSAQTTIAVAPGTGALFPSPAAGQAFKITLVSASSASVFEVCLCTGRVNDILTVVRGQEGTVGQPFVLNDIAGNFDTKGTMESLVQTDQLQAGVYTYAAATGTANALAATIQSALTSIPDGMGVIIKSLQANTGAATLTITLGTTVVGTAPIIKGNNSTLIAGDIPAAGYPMQLNYSSTFGAWVLQNPATGIFVSSVPTGAIVDFPAAAAPSGYLVCAGQLVSRTTYASLWAFALASGNLAVTDAAWQVGQFSPGNGSTTFRLPQFGGYFRRSLDQGNGIDPSRTIGTAQSGQNQAHTHGITDPGHNHTLPNGGYNSSGPAWTALDSYDTNRTQMGVSTTGITINSSGGTEARPINVSVLTCIKF